MVEPVEAKTIIDLSIVVEPVEAKTIIDPSIVVEPIEEQSTIGEGREGVKWELGFAFFGLGKWDLLDWDLPTGNGIKHHKMGMGVLFFSSVQTL